MARGGPAGRAGAGGDRPDPERRNPRHVTDSSGGVVGDAQVTLVDALGYALATAVTDAAGAFTLDAVPLGSYTVRAETAARLSGARSVAVHSALPVVVAIELTAQAAEHVVVHGAAAQPTVESRLTISGDALRAAPARLSSRSLQQMLATLPGWSSEDNGLVHVRGVDDGFLYVEDGVPVYDRVDQLFGVAPDPAGIGSLHVMTGYVPAEYGLKSGAVIEIRSAAVPRQRWTGQFDAGTGSDALAAGRAFASGPLGAADLAVNAAGERSDRFLDPVHPDNFHNTGGSASGGVRASLAPDRRGSAQPGRQLRRRELRGAARRHAGRGRPGPARVAAPGVGQRVVAALVVAGAGLAGGRLLPPDRLRPARHAGRGAAVCRVGPPPRARRRPRPAWPGSAIAIPSRLASRRRNWRCTRTSPSPSPTRTRPKRPASARGRSPTPRRPVRLQRSRVADAVVGLPARQPARDQSGHARRRPALRQHAPAGGGHAVESAARARLRLAVHLDDAARVGEPLLSAAAARAPAAVVVAGSPRPVAVRGRRRSRRRRGHARTRAPVGLGGRRRTVARRPGPRRPRRLVAVGGELRRSERVLRHHHRVPQQRRPRLGPRPRRAARAAARRRLVVVSHLHAVEGRTGGADQRRALPRGRLRRDRPGHAASRPITTSGIPPRPASPSSRATAAWSRR